MSTEENKAVICRYLEEAFNKANPSIVDTLVAPSYVYHSPGMPDVRGQDALKGLFSMYNTAFPDLQITSEDLIAEGDKVVCRWRGVGTHQGPLKGMPATGKKITVTGILISRLADGKIEEEWEILDQMGMMQQLGVIPAPGQAGG